MLCAVGLAATGVIPVECAAYDTVWRYLMPCAAACFLLETDVQRLASDGGPVLAGFALGAVGMVLGALAGWALLREPLGAQGAKLAACLCASYVGGSVNFAAVAMALHVPASSLPGAMAADNLMMAAFLAALMAVPVQRAAMATATAAAPAPPSSLTTETQVAAAASEPAAAAVLSAPSAAPATSSEKGGESLRQGAAPPPPAAAPAPPVTAESLGLTFAAAAVACAVSQHIATALNAAPLTLMIMAVVAAGITAGAQWLRRRLGGAVQQQGPIFAGASQVGVMLMQLFFAVIGASAGSLGCLAGCGVLLPFLAVMVSVHWAVVALVGERLLRLPREALLLGSNANIGGSATAAGTMGYATGTACGLAVARLVGAAG
ncbi:hypothetical protein GPECTOR_10g856 [Gonium pectorale]|uniref:DUF819 protein n=1 Tax=Gonium pectorale TaxID=33097 RepID=A0A150GQW4_GONPE|nr:hypothetical protein GPECTOR_10g856 [Gonium pectorale]|eukprot:KXZ52225.1 hypothetical protein GPECTOR_10g856 [Gonium pectorale]